MRPQGMGFPPPGALPVWDPVHMAVWLVLVRAWEHLVESPDRDLLTGPGESALPSICCALGTVLRPPVPLPDPSPFSRPC